MDNRPDLKAASARPWIRRRPITGWRWQMVPWIRHSASDFARNPPIPAYFGVSVSIPLRIFDRNQGEKLRTQQDITRNERLRDAATAQVFSDVDSAYATIESNLNFAAAL